MTKRASLLHILVIGALALASLVATTAPAFAQETPPPETVSRAPVRGGSGAGLGVGGAAFVSGLAGAQVDYDTAIWDIEGLLAFASIKPGGGNMAARTTLVD